MTFMAAITAAAVGAQALGSIAQAQAASNADKYNAEVARNNAQIAKQNATFAGEEGAANAGAEALKTRAQVGGIKTAQAANGIDVNSGSAVDVRSTAAELGELNAINIRSNAARQAYGYQTQSASDMGQAGLDKAQAKYDSNAGYINAATTLIGSSAKAQQSGAWGNYTNSNSLNTAPTTMGPYYMGAQ